MDEFRQARAVISIVRPQPGQSTQTSTPCPGIENSNGSLHLGQVRTAGLGGWYSCVMLARYSAIGSSGTAAVPWSTRQFIVIKEGRRAWHHMVLATLVAANGAIPYPAVVIGWIRPASAGYGHVVGGPRNLAFLKVGTLCESALVSETVTLARRMKFRARILDAAHRRCDLFGFEFFYPCMTAINGVLPVDGVNGSAMSGVPFRSQA